MNDDRHAHPLSLAIDALGLLLLLAALSLVSGCGAGAIRTHAQAVTILASTHSVAGATVDAARDVALDRVELAHPVRGPERSAALDAEAARWTPVGLSLDAVRSALGAWLDALDAAHLAGTEDVELLALLAPLAARAVLLYDDVAALASALGVPLPALPAALRALAASIGGA